MEARCAVTPERLYFHPAARSLAELWQDRFLLIEDEGPPRNLSQPSLWAVEDHLELHGVHGDSGIWIELAEVARRSAQGGDLLRACGVSGRTLPHVLDAMAGWGVDGLVLAERGCQVLMVERHPLVSALQQDLVRRSGLTRVATRFGDGLQAMMDAPGFDVVYLDPMFGIRRKGALPALRMQALASLAEADARPLKDWLAAAVAVARHRVVLKRRRKDPLIATPDWQILGRRVRYDVFRGHGA